MANSEQGETSVQIDGVSYTLAIGTNAMCELETHFADAGTPLTFQQVMARVQARSAVAARAMFWALLRRHHKDMTVQDAGDLLDRLGIATLHTALMRLSTHAVPDKKDLQELGADAPANPRKARVNGAARAGIGTGSSGTRGV